MKIAPLADVKARLSAYVKASGKEPVVITRSGKAVAALIALNDEEDVERLMLGHSKQLQAIFDAAHRRYEQGQSIPQDKFWDQLETPRKKKARKAK
jgi:prevent-host-death family protein